MNKAKFFPIGNADTALIETESGKLILVDYANRLSEAEDDKRINLAEALRQILNEKKRDSIDVVVFTHLDQDHYDGFSEFFYLEHAKSYQEGERIKISELWVPAAVLLETGVNDEADTLRAEARYRMKENAGIKVFSKPEMLAGWLEDNDMTLEDRAHLIVDAGTLVDNFNLDEDGLEIFIHSPFAASLDEGTADDVDRNNAALIFQITFKNTEDRDYRVMLGSDSESGVWDDIVKVTEYKGNETRLEWDVFKIGHHCSYKSLNENKENWEENHTPTDNVKKLFEEYGREGSIIVSSSCPIDEDPDSDQPPHQEAADYYKSVAEKHKGQFIVTMEHPSKDSPDVLELEFNEDKIEVHKEFKIAPAFIKAHSQEHVKPSGLWASI